VRAETDDLLQPTLADYVAPAEPPWRLDSQFWVAFFGGPLAVGGISYLNAGRLRLPRRGRILWVTAAALVAELLAVYVFVATGVASALGENESRAVRLLTQAAGVVAYPFLYRMQRPSDRVFRLDHEDEDYASLWGPGLLAVVAGGLAGVGLAGLAFGVAN
jgi:hypothetical protein